MIGLCSPDHGYPQYQDQEHHEKGDHCRHSIKAGEGGGQGVVWPIMSSGCRWRRLRLESSAHAVIRLQKAAGGRCNGRAALRLGLQRRQGSTA